MNDDLEWRLGRPADAAAIRQLTRDAYAQWVPPIGREPLPMAADYEAAVRAHRFDLLFAAGALFGLIETVAEPDHLSVVNVAVAPAWRGRGHGRALLAHAERIAASHGHDVVRLATNKAFAANLRLYRRLGYGVDREEPFLGGTTVHLSKRLGDPAARERDRAPSP